MIQIRKRIGIALAIFALGINGSATACDDDLEADIMAALDDSDRLADILEDAPKMVSCTVEDGVIVMISKRHDLRNRYRIKMDGVTGCEVEDGNVRFEYKAGPGWFSQTLSHVGAFFAGLVAGKFL